LKNNRTPGILFIFITMLIDVIGIGIIIPIIPSLLEKFADGSVSKASEYGGYLAASYAVMQFIFSPIIGGLSDQYGRRKVLLFSLFGFGIDYILLGFAPSLTWLFVGRIVAGIFGASFTTAQAYIADISTDENRAKNFGMVGAAFGIGFIIGPAMGGFLGSFGHSIPFFVSAGLTLLNWLYGYFVLPESLAPENRRPFDIKRANPLATLTNLSKYPALFWLLVAFFLVYLAGQVHPTTWTFFTMKEFNWTEKQIGLSLAFVGLMVAFVQGYLIRVIVPKIGDNRAIAIGLSLNVIGFLLFAFATQGWMMYAIMIPFGLGGIAGPSLMAIVTGKVDPSRQGELQGGITSLQSITTIIGPLIASRLFAYYSEPSAPVHFPGAAFAVGAFFSFLAYLAVKLGYNKVSV
jgi:MFS transporter, DHA1 family, tetracycline resistance protein